MVGEFQMLLVKPAPTAFGSRYKFISVLNFANPVGEFATIPGYNLRNLGFLWCEKVGGSERFGRRWWMQKKWLL